MQVMGELEEISASDDSADGIVHHVWSHLVVTSPVTRCLIPCYTTIRIGPRVARVGCRTTRPLPTCLGAAGSETSLDE